MRVVGRLLLGLVALVVALVAFLWIAVPPLISPTSAQPDPSALPSGWLAQALAPSSAGPLQLRLTPAVLTALVGQEVGRAAAGTGSEMPVSGAGVGLGTGTLTLQIFGNLPGRLPVPGWSGAPFQLDVQARPSLPDPDILELQLVGVRLGRIPLSALIPPARLLRWLESRVPLSGESPVSMRGAIVLVDLAQLPPLRLPQAPEVALRIQPLRLAVTPAALSLSLAAKGTFTADPAQLAALLSQWLGPGASMQLPPPLLAGGRMTLQLPEPDGALRPYTVTPGVAETGVLQFTVGGAGTALGLASWLDAALGGPPPWLRVAPGAVDIDFRRTSPLSQTGLAGMQLLPTAAQVAGGQLQIHFAIRPAPATA